MTKIFKNISIVVQEFSNWKKKSSGLENMVLAGQRRPIIYGAFDVKQNVSKCLLNFKLMKAMSLKNIKLETTPFVAADKISEV